MWKVSHDLWYSEEPSAVFWQTNLLDPYENDLVKTGHQNKVSLKRCTSVYLTLLSPFIEQVE